MRSWFLPAPPLSTAITVLCLAICVALSALPEPALAYVKVKGNGDNLNFDVAGIPASLRQSYDTMNRKCVKCHSMEMVVTAVLSGICPETRQPFDKQAVRAYGIKMIRKNSSDISKPEMREIVLLLNYLLDEQKKK